VFVVCAAQVGRMSRIIAFIALPQVIRKQQRNPPSISPFTTDWLD
jgi:hypothetical protein